MLVYFVHILVSFKFNRVTLLLLTDVLPTVITFGSYDGVGFENGELMDEDDKLISQKCFNFLVDDMLLEL